MITKLLVIGQLPPPFHGSTVMTEIFFKALKKQGFQVYINEKTFSKRMDEVEKVTIRKLLNVPVIALKIFINFVLNKPKLCFYLASVKPPSLYVDLMFLNIVQLLNCKVVLYLHGNGYERIWNKVGPIPRYLLRKTFLNCLGAMVLGESLKKDVRRFIAEDRIYILPNPTPESSIYIDRKKDKSNNKIQVLYLSNLTADKGPIEFLKMAKCVKETCNNVKFVLAGSNSSNDEILIEIEKYIRDNKLNDVVHRVGAVFGKDKDKLFMESDIFVFPTYYELECFPLVNLEAMRASLPVISTDQGSIPEAIIDGVNGYIVNPKEIYEISKRVLELVNNDELRKKMGQKGRRLYEEKYTLTAYEKNLKSAIKFFNSKANLIKTKKVSAI